MGVHLQLHGARELWFTVTTVISAEAAQTHAGSQAFPESAVTAHLEDLMWAPDVLVYRQPQKAQGPQVYILQDF